LIHGSHSSGLEAGEPLVKYFFNFSGAGMETRMDELRLHLARWYGFRVVPHATCLRGHDHALKGSRLGMPRLDFPAEHCPFWCAESRITSQADGRRSTAPT